MLQIQVHWHKQVFLAPKNRTAVTESELSQLRSLYLIFIMSYYLWQSIILRTAEYHVWWHYLHTSLALQILHSLKSVSSTDN